MNKELQVSTIMLDSAARLEEIVNFRVKMNKEIIKLNMRLLLLTKRAEH